jgi:hypothetical protein
MSGTRPPCSHYWHLSICSIAASRLLSWHRRNWCQLSIARIWLIACFISMCLANHLSARCFLRCPKRWKSHCSGLQTSLVTVYVTTAGSHKPPTLTVAVLCPVICISLDPLRSTWLASDDIRQAVTSWLQTLDTVFFYAGLQFLVPQWDICLCQSWLHGGPMCMVCYSSAINTSKSESLLPYFLKLLCISYKCQTTDTVQ